MFIVKVTNITGIYTELKYAKLTYLFHSLVMFTYPTMLEYQTVKRCLAGDIRQFHPCLIPTSRGCCINTISISIKELQWSLKHLITNRCCSLT